MSAQDLYLEKRMDPPQAIRVLDRKSTRLHSSHTEIYTLSLHDALPILQNSARTPLTASGRHHVCTGPLSREANGPTAGHSRARSEEHTSALQSHRDLHSFPTRRSSDLAKQRTYATDRIRETSCLHRTSISRSEWTHRRPFACCATATRSLFQPVLVSR